MTIWDNIYKNYQNGGAAYATLSEEIDPIFLDFISRTNFELKHVLDIGCGTGRYLKILKEGGFKTDGIDSSETAVEMTKKELGDDSKIDCVDMFEFAIPKNQYDLIISLKTIHHGTKEQIQNLINRIYEALLPGGKIFITLPSLEAMKRWGSFKDVKDEVSGTIMPISGPEKGLVHSFFTKEEVEKLFSKFTNLQVDLDSHDRWAVRAEK